MFSLAKIVHVLAVGLWFGAAVCFTFVALSLFHTFEEEAGKPTEERPFWLHVPPQREGLPFSASKEVGSRIAGAAVGQMFQPYFTLQGMCGVLAFVTAWLMNRKVTEPLAKLRYGVLLAALCGAALGVSVERNVDLLRILRNEKSDAVLTAQSPPEGAKEAAAAARAEFGRWHTYSLLLNFGTLALVTAAMGMAAFLPPKPEG